MPTELDNIEVRPARRRFLQRATALQGVAVVAIAVYAVAIILMRLKRQKSEPKN